MSDAAIRLDRVNKTYAPGAPPAVGALSLQIERGEVVVLVGPSGCGKTTTLKMINRIIEPTSGRIEVNGREIHEMEPHQLRQGIGYVIQQVGLFPHRTVFDNIATVPRLLRWDRARINDRVAELIDLVGLDPGLLARYPAELSGGQQQRAGVARALAADPPVLLMDEPFGAVDPILRTRLQDELRLLQERLQKTIVLVTHDIDEAIKLGDRIAIMNIGGVLEQYAPPAEILREPANAFVESFLGAERGLKRLSLVHVRDVPLETGPVVGPDARPAEAIEVMARERVDWVAVVNDGRVPGWISADELRSANKAGELPAHPFSVRVDRDNTLREALDAIVTSRTQVAIVCDGDHYLGMLTVGSIVGELERE